MAKEIKMKLGDFSVVNGKIESLVDGDKLQQQILKGIASKKEESKYHPKYGTLIEDLIGRYELEGDFLQPLIASEVEQFILYFQQIQNSQELFQEMSDDEVAIRLNSLSIDKVGTTDYNVNVSIVNRSGNEIYLRLR